MLECVEQFPVQGLVLAFQIEHGNGLGSRNPAPSFGSVLHLTMVSAVRRGSSHSGYSGNLSSVTVCGGGQLKRLGKGYIVVTLRESTAPGLPALSPPICISKRI